MAVAEYDIVIDQGAVWARTITWYLDDAQVYPRDVTSYEGRMAVKTADRSVTVIANADIDITFGTTDGKITLAIGDTITGALAAPYQKKLIYDLDVRTAGGQWQRFLRGNVIVRPGVSQ